jgi:protein-S-isoprenylcysteine O-methyltransferase Ste14
MYHYVQHPSYTTNIIIIFANFWLFERVDGAVGCWLSKEVVNWGGWKGVGLAYVAIGVEMLRRRIVDEEGMLRGVFGREWEVWHGRTKRFVPGVF